MDKKTFYITLVFILTVSSLGVLVRYYQPESTAVVSFDDFPLELGQFQGEEEDLPDYVIDLLRPQEIFSGTFVNNDGMNIHLLFDFFVSGTSFGGPHSPRNCLPGAGWVIGDVVDHEIKLNHRTVTVGRFDLKYEEQEYLMDFWYVTNFGETASDYEFKLFSMMSSIMFRPREVAFIRLLAPKNEAGLAALEQFEQLYLPEIYARLPFDKK